MAKKKGTRTRTEAKKLMWAYYRDNKASLPKWIVEYREEILSELMYELGSEDAFTNVVQEIGYRDKAAH